MSDNKNNGATGEDYICLILIMIFLLFLYDVGALDWLFGLLVK